MLTRRFALVLGIVFLLVGILGFIPGLTVSHHAAQMDLSVRGPGHGYLLGLFHVNWLHNVLHIIFGLWGIAASANFFAARGYARTVAVVYIILAILGLIPTGNTYNLWGLVPISGNDVWLHALIAVVAAYFGYAIYSEDVERARPSTSWWNRPPTAGA